MIVVRRPALWTLAALALLLAAALVPRLLTRLAGAALQSEARAHHATLSWARLTWHPPLSFLIADLSLSDERGATLAAAESLSVTLDPASLLALHPRPVAVTLSHGRFRWRSGAAADADTLAPPEETRAGRLDHAARVREAARSLARALLIPARRLPRIEVRDVDVFGRGDPPLGVHLDQLALVSSRAGSRLSGSGTLLLEQPIPFTCDLQGDHADHISGLANFELESPGASPPHTLSIALNGWGMQNRGVATLGDSTVLSIGAITTRLSGRVSRAEPRFTFQLRAAGISPAACRLSVPPSLLGPLSDLALTGTFDYSAALDLDFSEPDSVRFSATVTPHGLALDRARTRLDIATLDQPFSAHIHLPHDRMETREMSAANSHFVPLAELDSTLVHAVLANEDGAFFQHHGFNLPAVRRSIADNIHAAAFRRGAGTITMQLVRNLYLGHERTLSRKAQEVVLTWVLEHLTGVSKARMLEIYLNIVEWGPGICGAEEAAHYYFGHGARRLAVPEALFLATVLPAPEKWRWRFGSDGSLRPFEQAQMHFIGRAMVARGWLDPAALPAADSLRVELRGAARTQWTGPGVAAALDSLRLMDRGATSPGGGP